MVGGEGSFNTTSVCRPILSTWIYHTREYDLEVPRGEANPQPFDVFLELWVVNYVDRKATSSLAVTSLACL